MSALLNEESSVLAQPLPVTVVKGDKSVAAYAFEQGDSKTIVSLVRQTGALLFRGFDVSTPATFKQVVNRVVPELNDYRGGTSPRTKIDDGVYTSTEYPNQFEISLHNEMSYSATAPEFLFLACIVEPTDRGETPLADCRSILRRLSPELVQVFRRRKVKYQRNFFGRKSRLRTRRSWSAIA
jgi:alpha-ketoglutarate-dependent taurine dioxygenase